MGLISQYDDLIIPHDERALRRVQRQVDDLDRKVRSWADSLLEVLPKGLTLNDAEHDLLALFLAQQQRRNIDLDEQNGELDTLRSRLGRLVPLLREDEDEREIRDAAHRMVSTRLETEIERATEFFCRDTGLPGITDPVIDWRVAIRYMAQRLHHIASQIDLKKQLTTSPLRFELALTARDLALEIADKRRQMLSMLQTVQPN